MKKFFLLFLFLIFSARHLYAAGWPLPEEGKYYEVVRVLDGDTLVLRNEERVRLIGVDAPEVINSPKLHRDARRLEVKSSDVKSLGLESKSFLARLVEGKKIRLEYDGPRRDRNGRVTAHAYLENGALVGAEVLKAGYATVIEQALREGFLHKAIYLQSQKEAMEQELGIWRFISNREYELIVNEYEALSLEDRRAVLSYIEDLKGGKAKESYTSGALTQPAEAGKVGSSKQV